MILIVCIDDIILTRDNLTEIKRLKKLQPLNLGMEITRSKDGISMSQYKYVIYFSTETGMLGSKPSDTLIEAGKKTKVNKDQLKKVDIRDQL